MRTLTTTLAFFVINMAMCQDVKTFFGLKTGLNLSSFSTSINSDPSSISGFHIGGFIKHKISGNSSFRPEFYYSSQGQKDNFHDTPNGPSTGSTTTKVNYLNLPLLFEVGNKVSFQVGPQIGLLLSANEKGTVHGTDIDHDLKEILKDADYSLVLGVGFSLVKHLDFGVRYNLGLTTIFDPDYVDDDFPDVKNRVLHFYIGYVF